MESPPREMAVNLEDSGCVADGLRMALNDEDENSTMVRSVSFLLDPLYGEIS